jgi:small subunit ribosomal protein S8
MTDTISDMLSRIRNAGKALHPEVQVAHSKLKESIAQVLKREGYLADCETQGKTVKTLRLRLKFQGRRPVITGLKRISSPGLRRYVRATEVAPVMGAMGTAILSTPRGVMTSVEARKENVGGELLCYVW